MAESLISEKDVPENNNLEELKQLQEYVKEVSEKLSIKENLLKDNQNVESLRWDDNQLSNKDSTLKKNTAFVRKLKTYTDSQRESILKDIDVLNLSKYIGEVAAAIVEAKLKMSDITFMLQLCSLLHQRYQEFSVQFLDFWKKELNCKQTNSQSKLRVDLRFFADLITIGIFNESEALKILSSQLQNLTVNDKDDNNNLNILTSFCRNCCDDWAGLLPRKFRLLSEKHALSIPRSSFLPAEKQVKLRQLLKDYYSAVCRNVISRYKEVKSLEKINRKTLQTKGELSNERRDKFDNLLTTYKKLYDSACQFGDLIDEEPPSLPTIEDKNEDGLSGDGLDVLHPEKEFDQYDGDTALFENEDDRLFYEEIYNLKENLPGILFKDSEQAVVEITEEKKEEETEEDLAYIERELESYEITDDMSVDEKAPETNDDNTKTAVEESNPAVPTVDAEEEGNVSNKLVLDAFLLTLPKRNNRDLIDKAAIEFCTNLNTKVNRRKLVHYLFTVQRTRYDLLPFYSRLVKTLSPVMPDVAVDMCDSLMKEFRWHVHKKDQINIESKLKTVRYIGELVKFGVFTKSNALTCLKLLIANFSHHNIEMACALLDSCGRYLFRSKDSYYRTKIYLETIMRKKGALHMDARYVTMIENSYYYCVPPPTVQIQKEPELPTIYQYLKKLLFKDLNKSSTEKVFKIIRKFDWKDQEFFNFAVFCFTAVWNLRYNNIQNMASLLAGLAQFHDELSVAVADSVVEDIRVGMEINNPKFNQRRQSVVKYLGELFNYKIVDSQVIFKILYSFITFGVLFDRETTSPLDPPEHLFRISLVCTLLDTCGSYFSQGSSAKKLDVYIVYFQRYYWFKRTSNIWTELNLTTKPTSTVDSRPPFPVPIEHMVYDTIYLLRPKLTQFKSYEEAEQAVNAVENEYKPRIDRICKKLKLMFVETSGTSPDEGLTTITEETSEQNEELSQPMSVDDDSGSEDERHTGTDSDRPETERSRLNSEVSDREDIDALDSLIMTNKPKLIECKEDQETETLYERMMTESLQSRANDSLKPAQFNILPSNLKTVTGNKTSADSPDDCKAIPGSALQSLMRSSIDNDEPAKLQNGETKNEDGTVAFTFLTRSKGNKPQCLNLFVPKNVEFATKYVEVNEQEKAEKAKMKRLVLNMHEAQQEQEEQESNSYIGNQDFLLSRNYPSNSNRERRQKFNHPKGAPDADAIFGSGHRR